MKTKLLFAPLITLTLCAMMIPRRTNPLANKSTRTAPKKINANTRPTISQKFSLKEQIEDINNIVKKGTKIEFSSAKKKIETIIEAKPSDSPAINYEARGVVLGFNFSSRVWQPKVQRCNSALSIGHARLNRLQQENAQLKQQQKELEKQAQKESPQEVTELQEQLQKAQEKVETRELATQKILAQAKELPALENIKKRTQAELGKKALEKMMDNKPLKLSDIDTKAHFYQLIDAIRFDPATGTFSTKAPELAPTEEKAPKEPQTQEQEIAQTKLGLAKALQENEELKKELEKQKLLAQVQAEDAPEEEKDLQLAQLKQELKEAKEQYEQLEKQQQAQAAVPSGGLMSGVGTSYIMSQIRGRLAGFFGTDAADILVNLQEMPSINALADVIDRNTALMQAVLHK